MKNILVLLTLYVLFFAFPPSPTPPPPPPLSQPLNSIAMVDIASIIVGLAVFAQWCGILRFLSYFDNYNMLLLTLQLSLPSVLRFFVCAGILYTAFLLCGWLVLGAYHPKVCDENHSFITAFTVDGTSTEVLIAHPPPLLSLSLPCSLSTPVPPLRISLLY